MLVQDLFPNSSNCACNTSQEKKVKLQECVALGYNAIIDRSGLCKA